MFKYFCQFCCLIVLAYSCKSNSNRVETIENKDHDGYTERYQRRVSDYAKEGLYVKIDPQGKKVEEATYTSDTLHGWRILYYESGDTQVIENYRMGKFEGEYKIFYPDGQVKLTGRYVHNQMSGAWQGFYENGALKEVVTFERNQENGPFVEYYPNGKLKAEGTYLNGDYEHGELKLYDETGKHIKTMMCNKGVCQTTWEAEKN